MEINSMRFLRISAISLGLLDAGNVLAQERAVMTGQNKQQMRQQARSSSEPEQDAFRNVLQARIRAMSQAEQSLMRDLSVNGRERMARENAAPSAQMGEQIREGARYGRGFEARQTQSNTPAMGHSSVNASGGNGAAMGAQGGGMGNPSFSAPGGNGTAMGAHGGGSSGGRGRGR